MKYRTIFDVYFESYELHQLSLNFKNFYHYLMQEIFSKQFIITYLKKSTFVMLVALRNNIFVCLSSSNSYFRNKKFSFSLNFLQLLLFIYVFVYKNKTPDR